MRVSVLGECVEHCRESMPLWRSQCQTSREGALPYELHMCKCACELTKKSAKPPLETCPPLQLA
eukprot:4666108-Amphidinium_carterae.1